MPEGGEHTSGDVPLFEGTSHDAEGHGASTTFRQAKDVEIAMEVASTHLDHYHHIFTDKLYTHLDLAKNLWNRNTYLTGAIKTNSAGLPTDLSFQAKLNKHNLQQVLTFKKTPRGTFFVRQMGNTTYTME